MTGEELKAIIAERIERDPRLRKIRAKTAKGKATKADSFQYSRICSEIMSEELAKAVLDLDDREGICAAQLRGNYEEIMQTADAIQRSIDEKQGIHMQPRRPAFPAERVQQIAHSLVDPTVPDEKIVRRARSTATVSMSFHDDFVQENAAFRAKAGLKCYITRVTDGKCCAWCAKLAGRYEYGEEPEEVYHRHDNCGCTVTYENGRKRQDVWSKREWEVPEPGAGAQKPVRLTREQAATTEQAHLPQMMAGRKTVAGSIDPIGASPTVHTIQELLSLAQYARERGFQFYNPMQFDGDITLLMEQIDIMASLRDEYRIPQRIVLQVSDLGADLGKTIQRRTIIISSTAMRSDAATSAYLNADNALSSTSAIGIGVHEIGHLIAARYGEIGLDIARKTCYNITGEELDYFQTLDYLIDHVSDYSATRNPQATSPLFKPTHYHEIFPEVLAKHITNPDEFTAEFIRLLKEACNL